MRLYLSHQDDKQQRQNEMNTITTAQLNQVAELIGTTDKNAIFSAVLTTLTSAGIAVNVAFDMLFGAGAFEKFAGDLHGALNA